MNQYDVIIADDEEMPSGHDWLLIEHTEGVLLVIRESAAGSPEVIAEMWAGGRHLAELRGQPFAYSRAVAI
jgi:hypothetical protein